MTSQVKEEAPTNSVGSGNIAGTTPDTIGVKKKKPPMSFRNFMRKRNVT